MHTSTAKHNHRVEKWKSREEYSYPKRNLGKTQKCSLPFQKLHRECLIHTNSFKTMNLKP